MNETSPAISSLREIISAVRDLPPYWIFLPETEPWSLDSPCAVIDTRDIDLDDAAPPLAARHHLMPALCVSDLQQVVANAKLQLTTVTVDQLFDAFLFYYDNDAFMDFGFLYTAPRA